MSAHEAEPDGDRAVVVRNVIHLHRRGWSVRAIAEDIGIPPTTVHDMIRRWREAPPAVSNEASHA